jgi:hypothetical protein
MESLELGTKREVFEQVRDHLLSQNAKSVDQRGECKYRSPDGLKCAIGCLIPDDVYTPAIESETVTGLSTIEFSISDMDIMHTYYLLRGLQRIHDCFGVDEWEDRLMEFWEEVNEDVE